MTFQQFHEQIDVIFAENNCILIHVHDIHQLL